MEKINDMDSNDREYGITTIPGKYSFITVDKYWGSMTTIYEDEHRTVKVIRMRAGMQSSLEYHCLKHESYFVESGKLLVGFRVGRGVNKSQILNAGETINIQPGLMHMRIAMTDVVIIECSTPDSDSDSHIVEDGRTYKHIESI